MSDEKAIIRRILHGDVEAFALLVDKYQLPIVRFVRGILNDAHHSEDVAQDVFLIAYRKLSSYDAARGSFSTWLYTIARNRALNVLRRMPAAVQTEGLDRPQPTEADPLQRRELLDKLDRALAELPVNQKTVFVLAEFEQLSYQDIAQIEGVRLGTVKSRLNRAKRKLRQALRPYQEGIR